MNIIKNITEFSHYLALSYLDDDSVCIDATVGRGNDTLFLCENSKFVYGFDIQPEAIDDTKKLLNNHGLNNYELYCMSHEFLLETIKQDVDFIIFNLGYLPKGNKDITTTNTTTIEAIKQSLQLLKKGGAVLIVMYHGHQQGKIEREDLLEFCRLLDKGEFHVGYISFPNQPSTSPEILIINKNKC